MMMVCPRATVTPHGRASSVICTTLPYHEDSPSSANPAQRHPREVCDEAQAALTVTRTASNASQGTLVTRSVVVEPSPRRTVEAILRVFALP